MATYRMRHGRAGRRVRHRSFRPRSRNMAKNIPVVRSRRQLDRGCPEFAASARKRSRRAVGAQAMCQPIVRSNLVRMRPRRECCRDQDQVHCAWPGLAQRPRRQQEAVADAAVVEHADLDVTVQGQVLQTIVADQQIQFGMLPQQGARGLDAPCSHDTGAPVRRCISRGSSPDILWQCIVGHQPAVTVLLRP